MNSLNTTPAKIKALLFACIIGTIVSIGANFLVYSAVHNVARTVGKDTVPSIIAANHINALLADAHSNAMNAMVTKEKSGGKFWTRYRKDMLDLHSRLIDISENIVFGEGERNTILAIESNVSTYEYTLGGAVSNGAEISVDQFGEANRLMQQKILPASVALNKVYASYLDATYNKYIKNIGSVMGLIEIIGFGLLIILLGSQYYLYKKTHRVFNIGLLLATILLIGSLVYSVNTLNSVKSNLYTAKHDAFDSIQALWTARATAYNANALESLYLLHNGTGIVQTADTINFNFSAERMCSDTKAALNEGEFKGYLGDVINNITFEGENTAAKAVIANWAKYVEIDNKIRSLEYDSKHNDAILLCVGELDGQSNYEFAKFDIELGKTIDINQEKFDSNMNSVFRKLNISPYVTLIFFALILFECIIGFKPRIDEYKA